MNTLERPTHTQTHGHTEAAVLLAPKHWIWNPAACSKSCWWYTHNIGGVNISGGGVASCCNDWIKVKLSEPSTRKQQLVATNVTSQAGLT